jgi:hypothetical protein
MVENGGVMMNEFPGHYRRVWDDVDAEGVVGMNGTEKRSMILCHSSGSTCSASSIDPFTSAKSTVTCSARLRARFET